MRRMLLKDIFRHAAIVLAAFCVPYAVVASTAQDSVRVEAQTNPRETYYLLREYKDGIAVFYDDSAEPYAVYSVAVSVLPEGDRIQLKQGIVVKSEEELRRLLEDYMS